MNPFDILRWAVYITGVVLGWAYTFYSNVQFDIEYTAKKGSLPEWITYASEERHVGYWLSLAWPIAIPTAVFVYVLGRVFDLVSSRYHSWVHIKASALRVKEKKEEPCKEP